MKPLAKDLIHSPASAVAGEPTLYQSQVLHGARCRMALIAGVMIMLAALLCGWSALQAQMWLARVQAPAGAVFGEQSLHASLLAGPAGRITGNERPQALARKGRCTSGDYLVASCIFALGFMCGVGSLRGVAATSQMAALVAAEAFTLAGVAILSLLPVAM